LIQRSAQALPFQERLREAFLTAAPAVDTRAMARHQNVYTCGDQDRMIYFIERGQVKLLMLSPAGKECLLEIHTPGDIFGELCLIGSGERLETATTMTDAILKGISKSQFNEGLQSEALHTALTEHLLARLARQQQLIANLLTGDSQARLAVTLLELARKFGQPDPSSVRIELHISQEELSQMVGTTRPRISEFMRRFQSLGLIESNPRRVIVVREKALADYLSRAV
jgi:CRP-like cAMP-binding protein